ncbi:hypothetical protein NPX13_g7322 [Xylaria arbuscula]|uniref:Uncharacterized protein n=1 Tax=Xylaria arbuscula TaxID=114810 RepID=A0A9W8TKJ6_9PEZI|nr:hypothetical protein NPX13_g7322 [Xylaria arbuscula]
MKKSLRSMATTQAWLTFMVVEPSNSSGCFASSPSAAESGAVREPMECGFCGVLSSIVEIVSVIPVTRLDTLAVYYDNTRPGRTTT